MKNSNAAEKQAREAAYSLRGAKIALVAICITLVLSITAGVTLALLTDGPKNVENTFTPGKIVIGVNEDAFDGVEKKNVRIKNDQPHGSNIDSFIRVALVFNWVETENGETNVVGVGSPVEGTDYEITYNTTDWFQDPSSGYWYCKTKVAPGAETPVLITSCKLKSGSVNGEQYNFSIDILAQGIQTVPESTVHTVWPYVSVNSNGQLTH